MQQTATEIPTFEIPDYNLPVVEAKIAKLNRRGAKLGCEAIKIVVVKKWEQQIKDNNSYDDAPTFTVIPMTTIQVIGSAPKLNGWTLVSVVEPVEKGVLLRKFPGVTLEIPVEFREVTPDRCDHCHTSRQRNETFIVYNQDQNKWMVVGRTCLADFTGCSNPERIANYASALFDLTVSIKDDESIRDGGSDHSYYCAPIRSFLFDVAVISGREGFITATQAREHNDKIDSHDDDLNYLRPTGKAVFNDYYTPSTAKSVQEFRKAYFASITDVEREAAEDLVDGAMQWGKTQFVEASEESLSDYGHNMKLLLAADRVRIIDVGFVASVIKGYKRAMEAKKEQLTYKGHVGEIGGKITLPVTVKNVFAWNGQYGLVNITTMQDDEGNVMVWFAPADKKMTVGEYKVMSAKVKRHDEKNGNKSTVVTYPKFM